MSLYGGGYVGNAPSNPTPLQWNESSAAINAAVTNAAKSFSITTPTLYGMQQSVAQFIQISGYVSITVATSVSINVQITWTDENNTTHTSQNVATSSDGAAASVTALSTTGWRDFFKTIRAKNATTLTIATAGTVTTTTYDFGVLFELKGSM